MGKPELTEMKGELLEQKMRTLATIDVLLEEKDLLEATLKKFADKKEQEEQSDLLKFGLRCSCQLKDSRLHLIDGQRVVEEQENGVMCIGNGPYSGLGVQRYRIMAEEWLKTRRHAAETNCTGCRRMQGRIICLSRALAVQVNFQS